MIASERQLAVYNTWRTDDNNILINAVAGSGKTTLLLNLMRMSQYRVLFLAFNKSIKVEIQDYIDTNNLQQGKAMTLHSLGLLSIRKKFRKFKINNNKNYELASAVRQMNPEHYRDLEQSEKYRLNFMLMDMNDVSRIYLTNNLSMIKKYMISMDKPIHDIPNLKQLWIDFIQLRDATYRQNVIEIDFADMIYVPVNFNLHIPIKPTYVFIDEAQDLNLAQHTLIDNLINQGDVDRWVSVGDKNQSIYGFSGSHSNSFDKFKEKENVVELPLDICYRCPQDIITEANKVYDVMEGFKQNSGRIGEIDDAIHIKNDSMVVCRNTSPLIELYFNLLSLEKKCYIKGKDILGKLMSFLKPFKRNKIEYVINKSLSKLGKLSDKEDLSSKFESYRLQENLDSLIAIVNGDMITSNDKVEKLLGKINTIFDESRGGITLCTIHKSKGLESDVVYILNENLIPSKYAKSSSQLKQEQNLRYVARTRAKEEMYYLNL